MIETILKSEYFALFLIISLGIILGKIRIKGFAFEMSAVIFVALLFGHLGVKIPSIIQTIGLILFIYSVGIQAGPGFFSSFNKSGLKIIGIAGLLVISGAIVTIIAVYSFEIPVNLATGLFAGALTSTPGLATAIDAIGSDGGEIVSIGYGIAYPFGVVGVILFVNIIPKILKVDLIQTSNKYDVIQKAKHPKLSPKHFIVENKNIFGKTVGELKIRSMTDATISRIKKTNEMFAHAPTSKTILDKNDLVRAVGAADALEKVKLLIGCETIDDIPLEHPKAEVQWLIVTNKEIVNKTLSHLNLFENYNASVTRIRRSGIDLTPKPHSTLKFGDKLLVACNGNINAVAKVVGNEDKKLSETDFLPIALGVVLGILVGCIPLPLIGKLGLTGGVLLTALSLSRISKTGPLIWNISGSANQLIRQIGLLFFLAAVGTKAGSTLVETILDSGMRLFLIGVLVTIIPMLISVLIGHFYLKINFLTLLGTLTGGMTSTPGLSAVDSMADCEAASIAYATVYPIAMVILIVSIQIITHI